MLSCPENDPTAAQPNSPILLGPANRSTQLTACNQQGGLFTNLANAARHSPQRQETRNRISNARITQCCGHPVCQQHKNQVIETRAAGAVMMSVVRLPTQRLYYACQHRPCCYRGHSASFTHANTFAVLFLWIQIAFTTRVSHHGALAEHLQNLWARLPRWRMHLRWHGCCVRAALPANVFR